MIINTENSTEGRTQNIDTYHTEPISHFYRALKISQQLYRTNQYQQDFSTQDRAAEIKIDASQLNKVIKSCTSEGSYSGPIRLVVIFEFLFFYYEYNEI